MNGGFGTPVWHARRMPAALLLMASSFPCDSARAARVVLTGDAFVNGNSAEERAKNFGNDKKLVVSSNRRSFLQFDFSSLPAVSPADVRKATLYLFARKVEGPGSIDIHALAASWDEKTVTFDAAPVAGALVQAAVPAPASVENNYLIVDITAQVQSWLALGSAWNYGLELAPGAPATSVSFDSKESGARAAFIDVVLGGGGGGAKTGLSPSRQARQEKLPTAKDSGWWGIRHQRTCSRPPTGSRSGPPGFALGNRRARRPDSFPILTPPGEAARALSDRSYRRFQHLYLRSAFRRYTAPVPPCRPRGSFPAGHRRRSSGRSAPGAARCISRPRFSRRRF